MHYDDNRCRLSITAEVKSFIQETGLFYATESRSEQLIQEQEFTKQGFTSNKGIEKSKLVSI